MIGTRKLKRKLLNLSRKPERKSSDNAERSRSFAACIVRDFFRLVPFLTPTVSACEPTTLLAEEESPAVPHARPEEPMSHPTGQSTSSPSSEGSEKSPSTLWMTGQTKVLTPKRSEEHT